jgi:hypothetical protein
MELDRHERDQLMSITGAYGNGGPYWWGKRSMIKLEAKGLVEKHPSHSGAYRATLAGFELAAQLEPTDFRKRCLSEARSRRQTEERSDTATAPNAASA